LERSLELIVGLLGILKAGGAYVPIDPEYPPERIKLMLDESDIGILLTQESLEQVLATSNVYAVCLDKEQTRFSEHSAKNLACISDPDNLAYVMFTSGSTGRPKGIAISHRNIARLVRENNYASFSPEEVFLQFASISFDPSTFEIWGSLLNGARLVVPSLKQASLEELGQVIRENHVTTLWLTAGLFHQMVESRIDDLKQLHQLLAGGDVLSTRHVMKALRELNGCRVINGYGPTESTTFATCCGMDNATRIGSTVPIGRPIANTQVYILDAYMQPVPIGVSGELYISGDGLARGYLNSPDLTAEGFMPNPLSSDRGARMYRTGDLTRYLPDGEMEFLGRIDHQVKIRGFRVELGEIESVLSSHSSIEQAVVVAKESKAGDKQLVAYLVAMEESGVAVSDLRSHLKRRLPDYMIPSAFVMLAELPLTPNGKIDRKALPAPGKAATEAEYVAPRTLVEEMLAGILADVLKVDRAGSNDNFFELGGHSLLATQVMSRISDNFHVSLPLRVIFEFPTVAGLAERIESATISGQHAEIPPIRRATDQEALPLSFAQENLWLFEQLTPGTPTYNTCRSGRVTGPLDAGAVEATFNELLERHEALRTSYESVNGTPVQIVHQHEHYALPIIDISELSQAGREAEALRLSNQDAQLAIDLTESPVARAKLLRLDHEDHVFILSIHHIAYDLWSGGVLLEEIEHIYLACLDEGGPTLPSPPVRYSDFAVWQRDWLKGDVFERQLSYWKENLVGLSATPMEIPTDRPRPVIETMDGASEYATFSNSLNEGIQELARREGVTQFMALLSVFLVLLHRYTGQDDLVSGSVIANRNRAELDGVVGFFDNTIVLRVDASGNPTFREFLRRVRDVALGAYTNQYLPFDLIVKELQPERTSNRTPFIQAMFVFLLNYPAMEREIAGLKVVPYNLSSGKAMFDLFLGMRESERGLEGELAYNCDLFDAATIIRMCQHFERLLDAVVTDPDRRLLDLSLLDDSERTQVLVGLNQTQRPYQIDQCIQQMFEEQVERTPDCTAIKFEGSRTTYAQLNRRANQLARYLMSRGVGPEIRVGVCMGRSVEMVVAILGVLKAGGAYVPLDPSYPEERVAFMLEDAEAPILLTSERVQAIAIEAPVERILLDADWKQIDEQSTTNPGPTAVSDNLAYVIYTSGSTGQPKGVGIAHRSAVSLLNWSRETYPEDQTQGLLASTSICFDMSIFEMFLPLCFGGGFILVENALALPYLDGKEEVTLINTVPSAIKELLNSNGLPSSIKTVNLGGEPLSYDLAQQLYAKCPIEQLYNLYGPTETTTYSTIDHVAAGSAVAPTIGRPIANTQVYILDQKLNPVPVAVPGELYIGGSGVARGYVNRSGPTAEKFMPDPFSPIPGARMYRTGDRARWLADGDLEYLGRIDQQVKVRGYRVELGEIEAVLSRHPSVREAVVLMREDKAGDKRIVAYAAANGDSIPSGTELRAYLQRKLPEYMVPGSFVMLEKLPLTPSGKLNRKALPAPEAIGFEQERPYIAPRDEVELRLTGIWEKLFGVQGISIRDSFFDLGGHSLLGVQLMARIHEQFGSDMPLGFLLQNPTVERLASLLRQKTTAPRRTALVPIQPGGSRLPFFSVHPVGGNVLCYSELARLLGPEQPFYGFQLPDPADDVMPDTIQAMAAHYVECLREVQPQGPYRLGGWSMGGVVAFEMARLLLEQGHRVELLALIDSFASSDIPRPENLDHDTLLRLFVEDVEGLSGKSLGHSLDRSKHMDLNDALGLLLDEMRALEIVPSELSLTDLRAFFSSYTTNLKALLTYEPQEYAGKITLIKARDSALEQSHETALGWARFAMAGVEVHEIEGDHYSIINGPPARLLAAKLEEMLNAQRLSAETH
jgi:amino acid adenylation domain-containing protein